MFKYRNTKILTIGELKFWSSLGRVKLSLPWTHTGSQEV